MQGEWTLEEMCCPHYVYVAFVVIMGLRGRPRNQGICAFRRLVGLGLSGIELRDNET